MKRLFPLFALSLVLTGCYGRRIECLAERIGELQASSVSERDVRHILWQDNQEDMDMYAMLDGRIDKMVRDMNRMNVCPRQLDHRLSKIEKKLGIKSPRFGPDWQYQVMYTSTGTIIVSSATFTGIVFSSVTHDDIGGGGQEDASAGGTQGAISRAQRSQRYIE